MGWSGPSLIVIVILLTHEVLSNLNELIVVRHPPTANGSTRKLTCLSGDDGSALIWNYEPDKWEENTFTNFKPAKLSTKDVKACAIRNSTTCITEWDRYGGWGVVNSFKNPMGPVFDYRWEGFKEFTFEKSVDEEEYQYVGEMEQSSHSSVFSVRGSRNVNIFLCRKKNMMAGPCIWINIGGQEGKQSTIQFCKGGAPSARAKESATCEPMIAEKHDKNIINEYEWRTFRLKWISDESTIEVYDETQNSPLLYKLIEPKQQSLGHVSIASDGATRIRFHFYDYFLTKKRTKTISTKMFRYYDNFCIEILLGVCKECEIIVDMMGHGDNLLKSVKITDDETSELDGMMTWNLVKIDLNLRNFTSQDVKLGMRSGRLDRNSDKGNDQWAIGGLRTCKSGAGPCGHYSYLGSLRASTITVRKELRSYSTGEWPKTNCQKLSYDKSKSAVVDSFPMNSSPSCSDDRISQFTRELYETCGSWCEKFDEKSSVCKPIGCNCAYGFMGINCDEECAEQPRKHNRTERSSSRSEYYGRGNPTDTNYRCKNEIHLPPSCERELEAPTPTIYGYSRASFSLTVDLEGDVKLNGVDFVITMAGSSPLPAKHTSRSNSSQSSTWRLIVADLAWDAEYVIYAIAYVSINRGPIPVESPRRQFTSTPWGARCFGIESVTETSFTIFAHTESEVTGCGTYGRVHHTLGMKKSTEKVYELKSGPLLPYTFTDLEANIKYQVIVDVPTFGIVYHNSVKTLESAPGKVTFLHKSSVTDNRVTLKWSPPAGRSRDGIEYEVSIKNKCLHTKVVKSPTKAPTVQNLTPSTLRTWSDAIPATTKSYKKCLLTKVMKSSQGQRDSLSGCNDKNIPELTQNERPAMRVNSTKYIVEDLHPYAGYTAVTPRAEPGTPMNFTAIHQYQGVVLIKWIPLRFPATKVTSFEIYVEVLEKHLRNNTYDQFPMTLNYTVGNKKIEYREELPLLPSTKYRASIVSKNRRQYPSVVSEIEFSMPGSLGFAGQEEPELKNNASLIVIQIPEVVNATTNTTLKVFVKGPSKCTRHDSSADKNQIEIVEEWLAAEYTVNNTLPKVLKISVEQHHGVKLNCSLRLNEIYTFLLIVQDWISDNTDDFETSKITLTVGGESSIGMIPGLLVIFIVIAICLILLFGCYRKRKRSSNKSEEPMYLDVLPPITSMGDVDSTCGLSEARVYSIPNEPDSHAVSIEYFEEYTKRAAASGQLYSQFMLLRSGMIKPGETGMLPENIPKNRYRNLIAYDDTRVVLDKIPGDPHSDYINASYIRGYRKERAYIATQGPKPNTINDFWRMIWQEDVRVICMMSNVVEGVTQYSEKYWPDLGSRFKYGNISISNTNQQVFADFTFRKFRLSCYGGTREVTHLQYTGWPVLGMPSVQSFVVFLKKLVQTPSGDGPIVVHCHAGDGRSGVIILCDISLGQVIGESTIDVTAVTTRMRDSRANMVATPQQYLFAHIAIVESLMSIPTQLPCAEIFTSRLQKMRLQLIADLQRLEDTMWQEHVLDAFATQESSTAEYTTIDDIAPDISEVADFDRSRTSDRRSSAIDVVSVDGLKLKNQYLASWLPPPLTLARFWKFVVEENIQLIVILQCSDPKNTTCSDIIPDELILPSMPHMRVEPKTVPEKGEYFTSETLLLRDTSEKIRVSQTVTVLTCEGWQSGEFGKPPAPVALVSLWQASEKIPRRGAETLVLCNNGTSACGLYLAMCLLLERMAVEGECDVISSVRRVRKSNPGFVLSKNHCEYLYDAAEIYAEYFKSYANFN